MGNNSLHVYLGGAFEAKNRLMGLRDVLETIPGVKVIGTWLNETPDDPVGLKESEADGPVVEQATAYAIRDLDEIYGADLLILDTIQTNDRGGKDTEFGCALASGLTSWVVGPRRNVFQRLADKHFESWEPAIEYLKAGGIDEWWYNEDSEAQA